MTQGLIEHKSNVRHLNEGFEIIKIRCTNFFSAFSSLIKLFFIFFLGKLILYNINIYTMY